MTDSGGPVIRNYAEELRYNFCKAYRDWRLAAEKEPCYYGAVEAAWQIYCIHRDRWLFGGNEPIESIIARKKRSFQFS